MELSTKVVTALQLLRELRTNAALEDRLKINRVLSDFGCNDYLRLLGSIDTISNEFGTFLTADKIEFCYDGTGYCRRKFSGDPKSYYSGYMITTTNQVILIGIKNYCRDMFRLYNDGLGIYKFEGADVLGVTIRTRNHDAVITIRTTSGRLKFKTTSSKGNHDGQNEVIVVSDQVYISEYI